MGFYFISRTLEFLAQSAIPGGGGVASSPVPQVTRVQHPLLLHILLVIYFLICIALIVAVLTQTSKSKGLSGVLGGSTKSIFRGKKSFEEKLIQATNYLAASFLIGSLIVFLIFRSYH